MRIRAGAAFGLLVVYGCLTGIAVTIVWAAPENIQGVHRLTTAELQNAVGLQTGLTDHVCFAAESTCSVQTGCGMSEEDVCTECPDSTTIYDSYCMEMLESICTDLGTVSCGDKTTYPCILEECCEEICMGWYVCDYENPTVTTDGCGFVRQCQ